MNTLKHSLTIAMITDDFIPAGTGVGIHVQKMAREMAARGHRVIVITARRQGQREEETWEGVKVYRVFSIPIYGFYQALPSQHQLRNIFLKNSVGVLHCHYIGIMMLRAIAVAKKMGLPTILTTHMTVDHLTQPVFMRPWRPFLSRLIARVYQKFNHLICVSLEYAKQVERFNISSQVHFISNPIDFDGTQPVKRENSENFRILFAGRLNPEKNVPLLLRAFSILIKKNISSELLIAGQGAQEKELRELTESLKISPHVRFLGHVLHNNLPELYTSCDVFVLPSTVETQGLVALEAMCFKKPVIVTSRIISARELVDDGRNGFIVDADSPEELAQRLELLWSEPQLRNAQGLAGYEKSKLYTVSHVADQLEKIYQAITIDTSIRFDVSDFHLDKRTRCAFCQVGTFEKRIEHTVVSSNVRNFKDEYFAVWRCGLCRSLHALAKFPLDQYNDNSPFLKRKFNPFNLKTFENFYQWVMRQGVNKESRILFYGVNAKMHQEFFQKKGFSHFDIFNGDLNAQSLLEQKQNYYDCVIIFDHLERCEDPRLIFEFSKWQLRAGGFLIIHTPDAEKIKLPFVSFHKLHQPYRIHIASLMALENLAETTGFAKIKIDRKHSQDTLIPFINFRTFHDLPYFLDGTLESAFSFHPKDIFKKFWRIPYFFALGFLGGVFRDPSNLITAFRKKASG